MPTIFRTPHGILFSFGAALLAVALFTAIDATRRPALEAIVFPTGSGDRNVYRPAQDLQLASEVLRHQGQPYRPAQLEPVREADVTMIPTGQDDTGTLVLYRRVSATAANAPAGPLHVKTGEDRYLALTPITAGSHSAP